MVNEFNTIRTQVNDIKHELNIKSTKIPSSMEETLQLYNEDSKGEFKNNSSREERKLSQIDNNENQPEGNEDISASDEINKIHKMQYKNLLRTLILNYR